MKKFSLYTLFFTCFFYYSFDLTSQIHKEVINEVKRDIFKLDFAKSDSALERINQQPLKAYLKLYQAFVSYIVVHQIEYNTYCDVYDIQIDLLKQESEKQPLICQFLSELYLQRGIVEYQNDNSLNAVSCFSKSYSFWKGCEYSDDSLQYNLKLSGIFNLLIGNLPQPYSQMVSWFGYKGNTEKGFKDLKNYLNSQQSKQGDYFESLLYLGFSYLKFGDEEQLIEKFIKEHSSVDLPEFIQSLLVRCANKIRRPELCVDILNQKTDYPTLSYLQGKYMVQTGSDFAIEKLNCFLRNKDSSQFKADALRYLSWYHLLKGNKDQYWKYQDSIKVLSDYPTSEDRQAKFESDLNVIPDKTLLKARLLFDCGRYAETLSVLENKTSFISDDEKLEYYYRLGRCYQVSNSPQKALKYYHLAVLLGEVNERYFSSYSAIYAAQICLDNGDINQCKYYLQKAKYLNSGEYKYSISKKIDAIKSLLKAS